MIAEHNVIAKLVNSCKIIKDPELLQSFYFDVSRNNL